MSESLPRGQKGAREAGGDGDGAAGEACGRGWDGDATAMHKEDSRRKRDDAITSRQGKKKWNGCALRGPCSVLNELGQVQAQARSL